MFKSIKRKKIEEFLIKKQQSFYRIAYSYVKNEQDALDIIQDSIYKALNSVESLKESKYIKTWFYRIVVNTSIDYLRKNKQHIDSKGIDEIEDIKVFDDYSDLDLRKGIESLPKKYQIIIILRYFEDMKIEEISNTLDTNVNTVKTRLYKGLKRLRIDIEEGRGIDL